jgi:hypothetical protein
VDGRSQSAKISSMSPIATATQLVIPALGVASFTLASRPAELEVRVSP